MSLILENARHYSFWLLDKLKGNKVSKHYNDIYQVNECLVNKEVLLNERLEKILNHTVNTVPYYKKVLYKMNIGNFPVVDKNTIKKEANAFVSEEYNVESLIPMVTSGSTGTPFKVLQNKDKRTRNSADTMYFSKKGGFRIGEKLFYFKIWSSINQKPIIQKWLENIVSVDVINMQKEAPGLVAQIKKHKGKLHMLGYVSALETICKYLDKNEPGFHLPASSVITMSEGPNLYTTKSIQKYFGTRPLSRYSNLENGILAQQINSDDFVINEASYLVEIFDPEKNEVLPNGKIGRIVVTDYFNYGMPMIRYDTGDIGILEERESGGKKYKVLSKVEGRKLDQIFNTKGDLISSYIVYKNMWKYTEIDQYQFVQKSANQYLFKICINGVFTRADELQSDFIEFLGEDAGFEIAYVNEIPLLNSGKRKKVVNLMNT